MPDRRLATRYLRAFEEGDPARLGAVLHDDFELDHYALPRVVDKEASMALAEALAAGIPDGRFETARLHIHDDGTITGTTRFTGTQTERLDLRCVGLPSIPATGKKIETGHETGRWVPEGDQVRRFEAERPKDGGLLQALLPKGPFSLFDR